MADGPKPLVHNAADAGQVREATRKQKRETELEIDDLRAVLATPQGWRTLKRQLAACGVFRSIWHPSALIHYNSGKHDAGLDLLKKIVQADPDAYTKMVREELEQEKRNG